MFAFKAFEVGGYGLIGMTIAGVLFGIIGSMLAFGFNPANFFDDTHLHRWFAVAFTLLLPAALCGVMMGLYMCVFGSTIHSAVSQETYDEIAESWSA